MGVCLQDEALMAAWRNAAATCVKASVDAIEVRSVDGDVGSLPCAFTFLFHPGHAVHKRKPAVAASDVYRPVDPTHFKYGWGGVGWGLGLPA